MSQGSHQRFLFFLDRPAFPIMHSGGAERSLHELALRLVGRAGASVVVLCSGRAANDQMPTPALPSPGKLRALGASVVRRLSGATVLDCGYPVFVAAGRIDLLLHSLLRSFKPSVVCTTPYDALRAVEISAAHSVPVVCFFSDVGAGQEVEVEFAQALGAKFVACSRYLAKVATSRFGIKRANLEVVSPLMNLDAYRCPRRRPRFVTFINPVPVKGQATLLRTAALTPEIPYLFVLGWPMPRGQEQQLARSVAKLPNVRLIGRRADMRPVYGQTRLLVVPSLCEEAFGRVVLEAGINGIPAVVSNRGGLRELGRGTVRVDDLENPRAWASAIRQALRPGRFQRLCAAAQEEAELLVRSEPANLERFLGLVRRATR